MNSLLEDVQPTPPAGDKPKEFPVKTSTFSQEIAGTATDLVISRYSDRLLVVVTQIGKPGTFLEVTKSKVNSRLLYNTNLLFGKSSEEYEVVARAVAEQISSELPLVLALGFKVQLTPEVTKDIVRFVKSNF